MATSEGEADFVDLTFESGTIDGAPAPASLVEAETFDIVVLSTDGSRLFSGDTDGELDGSSPALRPNTLDPDFVVRQ